MKCSVCGKALGFWTKIGGRPEVTVCKECQTQGLSHLRTLAVAVGAAQVWKQQFALGWLSEFDEAVRKFQVSDIEASPLWFTLLSNIFKLVETQIEVCDSDLNFLADLVQKYRLTQSTPEIREAIVRIALRQAIQSWERGDIPRRECSGLILQKGEICHWEEPVGLHVQGTNREYVGSFASVSVPLGRGLRVRVGGFKGHPIDTTVYQDGGTGLFHITNQRVCFAGQLGSVSIPYKKMINLQGFQDGFIIQTSNDKKPGIFTVAHPELTAQLVTLASSAQEEDGLPAAHQKKTPLPA
jgi:hypothetical protein